MKGSDITQYYLFHPENVEFIEGNTIWTGQEKHDVFELLMSFPLVFLLIGFLWWSNIDFEIKLILLLVSGPILFSLIFWFYRKFKRKRNLTYKNPLLEGVITDCLLTNKGSDTEIFEVRFMIGNDECCFETSLARKFAETLTEKKILVVYQDSKNFLVL